MKKLLILLLLFFTSLRAEAIVYHNVTVENKQVNIIRINKTTLQYKLSVVFTLNKLEQDIVRTNNNIGVNLSFFNTVNYNVCGYLVLDGKIINNSNVYDRPYLLIYNNGDFNISNEEIINKTDIKYLVSAGSYLVKNGEEYITHNHFSDAFLNQEVNRTIIGVDEWNNLCIIVIKNCSIKRASLICRRCHIKEAINFDGGTSTQLYYSKHIIKSNRIVPVKLLIKD